MATHCHMPMEQVEEPPYLSDFSDEQVLHLLDTPFILPMSSHTQHVERLIQVITKIGTRAATVEKRDGLTHASLQSRKCLPKCETKTDFVKF